MTREEVIATLDPGEAAGYTVDALLHLLELAAWEMCSELSVGVPASRNAVGLAATIDRTVEALRKTHQIELEAMIAAAFEFVPRAKS